MKTDHTPKSNYDLFCLLETCFHLSCSTVPFLSRATILEITQNHGISGMAAENPFGFGYLLNTISIYLENLLKSQS